MTTNKPPGLQLYKRTGRRKSSTPTSPLSPNTLRKYGWSTDFFGSQGPIPEVVDSGSPSLDLKMPSPTFDLSFFAPSSTSEPPARVDEHAKRASDDINRSRPKFLGETKRPSSSSTGAGITLEYHNRPMYSPELDNDSTTAGVYHERFIPPRRSNSREMQEDGPGPAVQNITRTIYYDRPVHEENYLFQAQAAKKSRLNRLNPITLLSRRRSSQNANKLEDIGMNTLSSSPLPDNNGVSIRGTKVHDFSKPRSRKFYSDSSPLPLSSPSYPRKPDETSSPSAQGSHGTYATVHSPMFKEHFQESSSPLRPINTALSESSIVQAPSSRALPSFAKNLPLSVPDPDDEPAAADDIPHTGLERLPPIILTQSARELSSPSTKTTSPTPDQPQPSALPKHFNSTSSRFSFIGQQDSAAQEKLLEAKHKELENKKPASVRFSAMSVDDDMAEYDDYQDEYDEDDGFREQDDQVPRRNIDIPAYLTPVKRDDLADDACDEDLEGFGTDDIVIRNIDIPTSQLRSGRSIELDHQKRQSLQASHFTPQMLSLMRSTVENTPEPTPRDVNGFPIGKAKHSSPKLPVEKSPKQNPSDEQLSGSTFYGGLRISTASSNLATTNPPDSNQLFDDDLYFDSGEFGDLEIAHEASFDEELLDDPDSGIRDIPAENARRYEDAFQKRNGFNKSNLVQSLQELQVEDEAADGGPGTPKTSEHQALTLRTSTLTKDNLAAYHDALAQAASRAAANGKFERTVTFSDVSEADTDSSCHPSGPDFSSRSSRHSHNVLSSGISDDEPLGFDDEMDDDALIAAANSEALENDDDGFYGQEFGFYARAYAKDSTQLQNGGYFTSYGASGVKRSHSGKNNFLEPSLTPITERSEWSTRNSVTSFGHFTAGQPLPSPGITQLLERDSPLTEDELSFSALMKLRRGAFGGSSTSINSNGERHNIASNSSPLAHKSYNSSFAEAVQHRLALSSPIPPRPTSIAESSDEEDDAYGAPTLTQNTPHKKSAEPKPPMFPETLSGVTLPMMKRMHHNRTGSGPESVSYAQDEQGQWVLERRRTGDGGEFEVIERKYLDQMRI